ncbi:hypothetical protein DPMN_036953 [Dreissena polymorpha]|uniref:Uncharacterized protein n=1 Tax=Dreissena polymorpha TaxID=45954 RepID=A0A9D4ME05_DREPO|nr:hypothetical protein DPMN_036953 [Dreissena polymorpha]
METTRDLYSLYVVGKLMELLVNNPPSLVIPDDRNSISNLDLKGIGTIHEHGCSQVLEAGYLFQLLVVHGDVCTGIGSAVNHGMPYALALPYSLLLMSWSSVLVYSMRSMLSANHKLKICLLGCSAGAPHEVDAIIESQVGNQSATNGDGVVLVSEGFLNYGCQGNGSRKRKHPLRTHTDVLKNSFIRPLRSTALLVYPYSSWMTCTSHSSMFNPLRTR